MARRPAFRKSDLKSALAAAKSAGIDIDTIVIDMERRKITMTVARGAANVNGEPSDLLDKWIADDARPS